ncbi:phospholipid carrier-dependent glycosyltransferase [Victivallis sp. Marseille-Q1083]|uniref:phospholipid carrier-dependent glycosyltransferase n=1 Tax=Victivallis sp. Marseille-Q1083 TaxID=2717288 RepID=UPI001589ADAE|nr:phospholipid carrier-dependent glycosyltransferase [Victivallis sp. Marseille-Q1083]
MIYKRLIWAGIFIFILAYLGTIWYRPLFMPDETRYAEIAREMIANDNYVVPTLADLKYFEKPVMGYWLTAGSFLLFGETPFAARLAPALAALLGGALLWLLVRRTEDAKLALGATMIYLTCILVFAIGTYLVLDSILAFFLLGTLVAFYYALEETSSNRKFLYLVLTGLFAGGAFLTKGFLAFAVPGLTVVPYLIWQKRYKAFWTMPWIPLLAMLAVVLPWALLVHQRDPDYWRYFIEVEHLGKFTTGQGSDDRSEPFWYFIPVLLGGLLPWTLLLPVVIKGYAGKVRTLFQNSLLRYAVCSAAFPFLFFSISSAKLGTYILPCFPGLAILVAAGLRSYFAQGDLRWFELTVKLFRSLLVASGLAFIVYQTAAAVGNLLPAEAALYNRHERWLWVAAVLAVIVWCFVLNQIKKYSDGFIKTALFAAGPLAAMLVAHFVMPARLVDKLAPEPFLEILADRLTPETRIVAFKHLVPGAAWSWKRADIMLYESRSELGYGLDRPEGAGRLVSPEEFEQLAASGQPVVIVMDSAKRIKRLPPGDLKVTSGGGIMYMEYSGSNQENDDGK